MRGERAGRYSRGWPDNRVGRSLSWTGSLDDGVGQMRSDGYRRGWWKSSPSRAQSSGQNGPIPTRVGRTGPQARRGQCWRNRGRLAKGAWRTPRGRRKSKRQPRKAAVKACGMLGLLSASLWSYVWASRHRRCPRRRRRHPRRRRDRKPPPSTSMQHQQPQIQSKLPSRQRLWRWNDCKKGGVRHSRMYSTVFRRMTRQPSRVATREQIAKIGTTH